jgi:hypothetical protein
VCVRVACAFVCELLVSCVDASDSSGAAWMAVCEAIFYRLLKKLCVRVRCVLYCVLCVSLLEILRAKRVFSAGWWVVWFFCVVVVIFFECLWGVLLGLFFYYLSQL